MFLPHPSSRKRRVVASISVRKNSALWIHEFRIVQEREAGQGKHGDAKRAKQTTQARLAHLSVGIEFTCPECRLPLCDSLTRYRVASFVICLLYTSPSPRDS